MKKRRLILACAILLIMVGLLAWRFNWIQPVDTTVFLKHEPGSYEVKSINDGDTIIVDMNGTEEIVRFIGVDTPETHDPDKPVQCYGPEASEYTKQRIGNGRVRLVADSLTTNRDRYDRLLRYVVLLDGTYLNLELIEKGYGFAYDFPFAKSNEYHTTHTAARQAGRGLWSSCQPYQIPATGQWQSNDR